MTKQISFPEGYLNQTHATIRDAFQNGAVIEKSHGDLGNINLSSIITAIIHDTGRFVESYASDALYYIRRIQTLCCNTYPLEKEIDEIIVFGMRRNGVHDGEGVMSALNETVNRFCPWFHVERTYRRVLACHVHVYPNKYTHTPVIDCELRNITDSLHKNNPADLDENEKLLHAPFPDGNPIPQPLYPDKNKENEETT